MQENKTGIPSTEPFVRRHRPFFVTLFVLVPVVMMPALLIFTMVKSDSFQQWCTLYVICDNSYGLNRGNQVSMSGINIGHVRRVDLIKEGQIHITFDVSSRYKHIVRKDTKARLKQKGFVGDWELELAGGTPEAAEVTYGDTLSAERAPSIDWFIELAVGVVDTAIILLNEVTSMVRGIESGDGIMGQLFKNDTLFHHVNRISTNADALMTDARRLARDAHGAIRSVQHTIRNADTLMTTLASAVTEAGRSGAVAVDTLMTLVNTVNRSLDDVGHILKNVKKVSDDAPELMDRLQRDLGEVEMMLRSFQDSWQFRAIGGTKAPRNPHLAETP